MQLGCRLYRSFLRQCQQKSKGQTRLGEVLDPESQLYHVQPTEGGSQSLTGAELVDVLTDMIQSSDLSLPGSTFKGPLTLVAADAPTPARPNNKRKRPQKLALGICTATEKMAYATITNNDILQDALKSAKLREGIRHAKEVQSLRSLPLHHIIQEKQVKEMKQVVEKVCLSSAVSSLLWPFLFDFEVTARPTLKSALPP